jgi:Domain of unknown function (DUF4184)
VRMIPWLEEPVVDIGTHRVMAVRLLQDGSSLIGLVVVVVFVWYGLRRGRGQAMAGRLLPPSERHAWVLTFVGAAIALSAAWLIWARFGEPRLHSATAIATGIAVSALRGLASALLVTSLSLDWRLRALRVSSARRPP